MPAIGRRGPDDAGRRSRRAVQGLYARAGAGPGRSISRRAWRFATRWPAPWCRNCRCWRMSMILPRRTSLPELRSAPATATRTATPQAATPQEATYCSSASADRRRCEDGRVDRDGSAIRLGARERVPRSGQAIRPRRDRSARTGAIACRRAVVESRGCIDAAGRREPQRFGAIALFLAVIVGAVFGFAAGYMARPRALQSGPPQEIARRARHRCADHGRKAADRTTKAAAAPKAPEAPST